MAVLIQIRDAHKSYGDQILLDGAEATLIDDVKVGFVGRNGAGKSTLLRILLDEEELESGEVIKHPDLRVGYLRQHDPFQPDESALDFLMRDSGQPDWKCGEVAGQFELKGTDLEGPVSKLSSGWQTRVKLAALLLHDPNLLLLDEPTNFLDLRTQILLEHFLRGFRQACLIVSHDRTFLTATCTHTLEISRGKLTMYPGKIEAFIENQKAQREHDRRVNTTVIAKQQQLQRFVDKNRGSPKTSSQARSKQKQLDRLRTTEIEVDDATAHIRAPIVEPRQGPAVRCMNLDMGYMLEGGDKLSIASGIDLEIEHGSRTAIVGDNGQGKTTLLRTIVGSLEQLGGGVRWGHHCEIGTYAQHVYASLPEHQMVLDYLEYKANPETADQHVLALAGALLFRDSHVKKKIKVLSGGERARLCLAGLLLGTYNILVLDEPGNHLDVETTEALAQALLAYKGTVIFTAHDRSFMQRVATFVIEVRDGRARNYIGDYDAYLYAINKEIDEGERHFKSKNAKSPPSGKLAKADHRTAQRDQRKFRKKIGNLERKIARIDDKKRQLNKEMLETTDAEEALRLHNEVADITKELGEAEESWLELQEDFGESDFTA